MQRQCKQAAAGAPLLFLILLLLSACGSSPSIPGTTATASATAAPQFTPTPTPPNVAQKSVSFVTQDHVKIAGRFYGKSGPVAIVCSPMSGGLKSQWSDSAPWFAARGYMVLAYDYRGHGDSGGQAEVDKAVEDLVAAIAFVHNQGAQKVILLGASMGASLTLIVAAQERVAATITLSPEYYAGLTDQEVKAINVPKLFISSENDFAIDDVQKIYKIASQPKELHIYSGSAHGTNIFETDNGQDLIARIIAFTEKYTPTQG